MKELLEGREWKILSDITKVKKQHIDQGMSPYIEIGDIDIETKKYRLKDKKTVKGSNIAYKHNIIISRVRPTRGAVSIINDSLIYVSSAFTVLEVKKNIIPQFVFYYVAFNKKFYGYLNQMQKGTSYPSCREKDILHFKICLPNIATQEKIVTILEKIEQTKYLYRQENEYIDKLLRNVFLDIFGDPVRNPMKWKIVKLKESFRKKPKIGTIVPASDGGNHIIVRVGDLGKDNVKLSQCKKITLSNKELSKFLLEKNDILLARAIGSLSHLGKASLFQVNKTEVVFDSHVMRLQFNNDIIHPYFFLYWLKSKGGRARFIKKAGRTAVQYNINSKQISDIDIPLPPIGLQFQFVKLVEKMKRIRKEIEKSYQEADSLFKIFLQKAFTGELIA